MPEPSPRPVSPVDRLETIPEQPDDPPEEQTENDLWEGLLRERLHKLSSINAEEIQKGPGLTNGASKEPFADVGTSDADIRVSMPMEEPFDYENLGFEMSFGGDGQFSNELMGTVPEEGKAETADGFPLSAGHDKFIGSGPRGECIRVQIDNQAMTTTSKLEFHQRREVSVTELVDGDSLGLLLTGTVVSAFTCPQAEKPGWRVGDRIIEVNGEACSNFDEFLEMFIKAQEESGFPIKFTVVRRESLSSELNSVIDIDEFCKSNVSMEISGQLTGRSCMLENPYVKALRRRRIEFKDCAEGWNSTGGGSGEEISLASRLATQHEAVATLENELAQEVTEPSSKQGSCGCGTIVLSSNDGTAPVEPKANRLPTNGDVKATPWQGLSISPCFSAKMELASSAEPAASAAPEPATHAGSGAAMRSATPCWGSSMEVVTASGSSDVRPPWWQRWSAPTSDLGSVNPDGYKLCKTSKRCPLETPQESPDEVQERETSFFTEDEEDVSISRPQASAPASAREPPSFNFAMQLVSTWGPAG